MLFLYISLFVLLMCILKLQTRIEDLERLAKEQGLQIYKLNSDVNLLKLKKLGEKIE